MKSTYNIFIITLVAALLGGCCSDLPLIHLPFGTGQFRLSVLTTQVSTEDITRSGSLNTGDFKVTLSDANGVKLISGRELKTISDEDRILPEAKDYLIEASSCSPEEALITNEGWGNVRFFGAHKFEIKAQETTAFTLVCSMDNAGLMVTFDQSFIDKFPYHAATTADTRSLVFSSDTHNKVAYYNLNNDRDVTLKLTGSGGGWSDRLDKDVPVTLAKGQITCLNIKYGNSTTGITVTITTDPTFRQEKHEVTIE